MAKNDKNFFTADELVKRWRGNVTVGTLANWRSQGAGPRFTKIGNTVLYARADIEAYEKKQNKK